jgi:DNA mismatch endonuclease (patch repair protein)
MAAVRNKNSKAERTLRRELHSRGMRYRIHGNDIVGRPDLLWRGRRIAVFVDGDMWHGNIDVWRARGLPTMEAMFPTRSEWWVAKVTRTQARDAYVNARLKSAGWTVIRLWESEILDDVRSAADRVVDCVRAAGNESTRVNPPALATGCPKRRLSELSAAIVCISE